MVAILIYIQGHGTSCISVSSRCFIWIMAGWCGGWSDPLHADEVHCMSGPFNNGFIPKEWHCGDYTAKWMLEPGRWRWTCLKTVEIRILCTAQFRNLFYFKISWWMYFTRRCNWWYSLSLDVTVYDHEFLSYVWTEYWPWVALL